jgi:hypothetical protein
LSPRTGQSKTQRGLIIALCDKAAEPRVDVR